MNKRILPLIILALLLSIINNGFGQANYLEYHRTIIKCERLIANREFNKAISSLDSLFKRYDFVFLRDIRLAAELSAFQGDTTSTIYFIRQGIENGWTWKSIKKKELFAPFRNNQEWQKMENDYGAIHSKYLKRLNMPLREESHKMLKRDQTKALGVFFRIGEKAKARHAQKKFGPHSEKQMKQLNSILDRYGYPGEKLIGNNWWMSVVLSHHNSISVDYNSKDTLYFNIKPRLMMAIKKGEMSPTAFAVIADWRMAALNNHNKTIYGFLGSMSDSAVLQKVNENRSQLGLRSVELRNQLIALEKELGINLYLPKDWQKGKILVQNKD